MELIRLSKSEWEELRLLKVKHRWDWPAVFSVSPRGEIWPFVTYGRTPESLRENVRGMSRLLDELADTLLYECSIGGRFFLDENGAHYKNAVGNTSQFAYFVIAA